MAQQVIVFRISSWNTVLFRSFVKRKGIWIIALVALFVLSSAASFHPHCSNNNNNNNNIQHSPRYYYYYCSKLKASSYGRSSTSDETAMLSMLQQKTVKELLQIAKNYPEYSSKIRLKKDLLQFVATRYHTPIRQQQPDNVSSSSSTTTPDPQQTTTTRKTTVRVRGMPSYQPAYYDTTTTHNRNNEDTVLIQQGEEHDIINTKTKNNSIGTLSKKEILHDLVLNRYPPLQQSTRFTTTTEPAASVDMEDIRAQHHPMLVHLNKTSSDLDIVFIGTASCVPSSTRGVSCTALRLNWRRTNTYEESSTTAGEYYHEPGTWLFDCGECTQLQLQRTSYVRPGKITKIFITHAHGDHSFGLPGVLCLLGKDRPRDAPPLEIYGPEGLRMWLRVAIRYSVSRIVPNYIVHELKNIPMAPEWRHTSGYNSKSGNSRGKFFLSLSNKNKEQKEDKSSLLVPWGPRGLAGEDPSAWISQAQTVNLQADHNFGEVSEGRDIYPQFDHPDCVHGAPIWEVENEGDVAVFAAPMSHGIPCVGYVVKEQTKPGRLRPDLVQPIIERNFNALKESVIRNPLKIMAVIKNLPVGSSFTFPDGTVIKQSDVVEHPIQGRKIVILGDTLDPRAIEGLAKNADVLIHEATNTYLSGIDSRTSLEEVTLDCKRHGHSTPYMAGEFAKRIGVKRLILNHFSSRYKGDQCLDSIAIMTRIERQAIEASGLPETHVASGWDFMMLPVIKDEDKS